MPRKKMIYTHLLPYHVVARSNNKVWFRRFESIWEIFKDELIYLQTEYGAHIHAFVLMSNHYHLVLSATEKNDLGYLMNIFQSRLSRRINSTCDSINHVFGGQYRASLITNSTDFVRVLKYVYQNPVKAKICKRVESYMFSTVDDLEYRPRDSARLRTTFLDTEIFSEAKNLIAQEKMFEYLNKADEEFEALRIKRAIRRTIFNVPVGKHLHL